MQAWRIGKAGDIEDLSGNGAALFGGRWNHADQPALYFGLSPTDCALDPVILAGHVPRLALKLMQLQLPDDPDLYQQVQPDELPEGWDTLPADKPSMDFGSAWLTRARHLGLILPSVVTGHARCLLVNPAHAAMKRIEVMQVTDFIYGKPVPPTVSQR